MRLVHSFLPIFLILSLSLEFANCEVFPGKSRSKRQSSSVSSFAGGGGGNGIFPKGFEDLFNQFAYLSSRSGYPHYANQYNSYNHYNYPDYESQEYYNYSPDYYERFGQHGGNGGGNGFAQSFSTSNNNGIVSTSGVRSDSTGKVTTYQGGTGLKDTITTRKLAPGSGNGAFVSSGISNNNGEITSYRTGGVY